MAKILVAVCHGTIGSSHDLPDLPTNVTTVRTRIVSGFKSLAVAFLPLTLILTGRSIGVFEPGLPYDSLLFAAAAWMLVLVLGWLDPLLRDRIGLLREMLSAWK